VGLQQLDGELRRLVGLGAKQGGDQGIHFGKTATE
jgi:hypothetical protein